jgi:hypothetical protein
MLAVGGSVPFLHAHTYSEHDHPEHRHGPAAHQHRHAQTIVDRHHGDDRPTIESCEPGQHAVSLVMRGTTVSVFSIAMIETESPTGVSPTRSLIAFARFEDVRVHSPPDRPRPPARAPPLALPA